MKSKTNDYIEHDLWILDLISDSVCYMYGTPGVYGVVSENKTAAEGINIFLSGFDKKKKK